MAKKSKRSYKSYSAEQKIKAVRDHLVEKVPVTQICKDNGIQPSVYYGWQKSFFERGTVDSKPNTSNEIRRIKALEKRLKEYESKLSQKNEVISELMEEHISLKKKSTGGI